MPSDCCCLYRCVYSWIYIYKVEWRADEGDLLYFFFLSEYLRPAKNALVKTMQCGKNELLNSGFTEQRRIIKKINRYFVIGKRKKMEF